MNMGGASVEAGEYFRNLDISQHLLNNVKELHLDAQAGLYRVATIHNSYFGFNMGGFVPISAKAIDDLTLLPNLRKICIAYHENNFIQARDSQLENLFFGNCPRDGVCLSESFIQALKERNIKLCRGDICLL